MLLQLIIIQVVTFAALLFILRMLFYRQLNSAVGRLKNIHEQNLAREQELNLELDKIKKEKDTEIAKTREEAERIVKVAREKAARIEEQFQSQGKESAQKIIEAAKTEGEKLKAQLEESFYDRAVSIAVEIVSRILGDKDSRALQRQFIDDMIEDVRMMPASQFTVQSKTVKIKSAYPLHEREQQELVLILSEKTGIPVELVMDSNSDIVAGMVIEIGALTLDGSLKNKINKALSITRKPAA